MIDQEKLKEIEWAINSRPCPLCGRPHSVELRQNSTHASAISSAVRVLFPTGDAVSVSVVGESCEDFPVRVADFVRSMAAVEVKMPFDNI